jgi:hypothetical protein
VTGHKPAARPSVPAMLLPRRLRRQAHALAGIARDTVNERAAKDVEFMVTEAVSFVGQVTWDEDGDEYSPEYGYMPPRCMSFAVKDKHAKWPRRYAWAVVAVLDPEWPADDEGRVPVTAATGHTLTLGGARRAMGRQVAATIGEAPGGANPRTRLLYAMDLIYSALFIVAGITAVADPGAAPIPLFTALALMAGRWSLFCWWRFVK